MLTASGISSIESPVWDLNGVGPVVLDWGVTERRGTSLTLGERNI